MYTVCVAQCAVAAVLYRCCADARSAGRPVSCFVHSRSDVCYSAAFDVTLADLLYCRFSHFLSNVTS